mgnify:CR=1 FL=1
MYVLNVDNINVIWINYYHLCLLLFLFTRGEFINRGTSHGPWLPIYGVGGTVVLIVLKKFRNKPWLTFLLSMVLCGVIEYFTSLILEKVQGMRWWDYSGYFLNFRGYICLVSALGFGIAGVLWVCIFSKILQKWWYHISLDFRKKWNMFWVFIFVTDCAASLIFPNTGHSITF